MNAPVTARLKEISRHEYNIVCGATRGKGPCPGSLGHAFRADVAPDIPRYHRLNLKPNDWYVERKQGYRIDDDGYYHPLTSERPRPRRPLPSEVAEEIHWSPPEDGSGYVTIGQTPILPAHITCPECGALNAVPRP